MNHKYIFIVNGHPRSGKTTFGKILNSFVPCTHISIIDPIKELAERIGWHPEQKTEKDRKFLSDLKDLLTEYNDYSFLRINSRVIRFLLDDRNHVLLIDMREPEDIRRAKEIFSATTIFIDRPDAEHVTTNHADANVEDIDYDIVIPNKGTIDDFREDIARFVKNHIEFSGVFAAKGEE